MRRLYGVINDEITQMAKIRYLQMKDGSQGVICRTMHEHNGMVMQKLKEDGSKKRMVNEVQRFWHNFFCTSGKVTPGQKKEMIGKGMTSER